MEQNHSAALFSHKQQRCRSVGGGLLLRIIIKMGNTLQNTDKFPTMLSLSLLEMPPSLHLLLLFCNRVIILSIQRVSLSCRCDGSSSLGQLVHYNSWVGPCGIIRPSKIQSSDGSPWEVSSCTYTSYVGPCGT